MMYLIRASLVWMYFGNGKLWNSSLVFSLTAIITLFVILRGCYTFYINLSFVKPTFLFYQLSKYLPKVFPLFPILTYRGKVGKVTFFGFSHFQKPQLGKVTSDLVEDSHFSHFSQFPIGKNFSQSRLGKPNSILYCITTKLIKDVQLLFT
jgi:hypothetical protein